MLDPITATLAARAGLKAAAVIEQITAPQSARPTKEVKAADSAEAFEGSYQAQLNKSFKKFLTQHPEIVKQLGNGPYQLSQQEGHWVLSASKTGEKVSFSKGSPEGLQLSSIVRELPLKSFEKPLEIARL